MRRNVSLVAVTVVIACGGLNEPGSAPDEAGAVEPDQDEVSCGLDTGDSDKPTVDGSSLWVDVPNAYSGDFNSCSVYQFAANNWLWAIGDDGSGHPRFMSFVRWDSALPPSEAPDCSTGYEALNTRELDKLQAGDAFELIDVGGLAVEYDVRISGSYCAFIAEYDYYTTSGFNAAAAAFSDDPSSTEAIWLPPGDSGAVSGDPDTDTVGAIEIKTAWRSFGSGKPEACDTIMHCEQDVDGLWWGLSGMHWAQKTPTHGELIWASFEHVANAPDCTAGSNPIQQNPQDPTDRTNTINVNAGLGIAGDTGWSYFDYASYQTAGGGDQECSYPEFDSESQGTCSADSTSLCNTDPVLGAKAFQQVNICRTDELPPAYGETGKGCNSTGSVAGSGGETDDEDFVSCVNQRVLEGWPGGLADKWKYYFQIGALWVAIKNTGVGASPSGCFDYYDPPVAQTGSGPAPTLTPDCQSLCTNEDSDECPSSYQMTELAGLKNLASTTMETWMQKGMCNQYLIGDAGKTITVEQRSCFTCHTPVTSSIGGSPLVGGTSHLFATIQNPD